jgi:hypothetical protein
MTGSSGPNVVDLADRERRHQVLDRTHHRAARSAQYGANAGVAYLIEPGWDDGSARPIVPHKPHPAVRLRGMQRQRDFGAGMQTDADAPDRVAQRPLAQNA